MISAFASQSISKTNIRELNISRDLDRVADLIEQCFPLQYDQDGQTYIREMRKAAREMRLLGWLSSFSDFNNNKSPGFVWEEEGQILGNLSMIPFVNQGRNIYLVANVAVDPKHRRRGIARALTDHALAYLQNKHISEVWLQVRDDNPAAYQLYRSAGFVDHVVRTTWRIIPNQFIPVKRDSVKNVKIGKREKRDWTSQKAWLLENYPISIRWNLSLNFARLEPGLFDNIFNLLDGINLRHWAAYDQNQCLGVISWQKTNNYANNLWLAFPDDVEPSVFSYVLEMVMKRLPKRHPISIDFPKGRYSEEFTARGFIKFRSLIWMKQNFN